MVSFYVDVKHIHENLNMFLPKGFGCHAIHFVFKTFIINPSFLLSHACAGLIKSDVFAKNDSLVFSLDIEGYNLQWLDFGQTNNLTFSNAKKLTNTGGIYEGWRVANHDEVLFLWEDIFL